MWRMGSPGYETYLTQKAKQEHSKLLVCHEEHTKEQLLGEIRKDLLSLIIKSSKIDHAMYQQIRVKARILYMKLETCVNRKLIEEICCRIKVISHYELWIQKLEFSRIYPNNPLSSEEQKAFIGYLPLDVIRLIGLFINNDMELGYQNIFNLLDTILLKLEHVDIPESLPKISSANPKYPATKSHVFHCGFM